MDHDHSSSLFRKTYHKPRRKNAVASRKRSHQSSSSSDDDDDDDDDAKVLERYASIYHIDEGPPTLRCLPRRRPLPASFILATTQDVTQRPACPLLQEFLAAHADDHPQPEKKCHNDNDENDTDGVVQDKSSSSLSNNTNITTASTPLDDAQHSTLTIRQHGRYRQLVASLPNTATNANATTMHQRRRPPRHWPEPQRREFQNLQQRVQLEQQHYRDCVQAFWEAQRAVVLTGFLSSSSSVAHDWVHWITTRTTAAAGRLPEDKDKSKQDDEILLQYAATSSQNISLPWQPSVDELERTESSHLLHTDHVRTLLRHLPPPGRRVQRQTTVPQQGCCCLSRDTVAWDLVASHQIDLLLTDRTLRTLLRRSAAWTIPVARRQGATWLGEPRVDVFASPRDCLTRALEAGVEDWLGHTHEPCYTYTLLLLPPVRHQPRLRVLVRSETPCRWRDSSATTTTLKVAVHVDYFPQRGREICDAHERILWWMHHHCFGSSCHLVRIDPRECQILSWERVGKAHALLNDASAAADLWNGTVRLLQAVPTIGPDRALLCFPARDSASRSVSVHAAVDPSCNNPCILESPPGAVPLDAAALARCVRPWRWEHDRIPQTFPPAG